MPKFSQRSLDRLSTCDDRLQRVFKEVIKHWDCTILEGHRDKETQNEYYRTGKSKLRYPQGKHNSMPSKAVDVIPYYDREPHYRWDDWNTWYAFAGFVLGVAASMGIKLRSGLDWDRDKDFTDQSFNDAPHFELDE